jgi:myo-inositol-1(or 4)-monophosphatase
MNPTNFATHLARETGQILLNYYQRAGVKSKLKSDHTIVTEADKQADQYICQQISNSYPEDGILSEESCTIYPKNKKSVWIIDPLDGTTNFSLGLHYWGISIARMENGFPVIGVLYFPLLDEIFTSGKGKGAFLNGNRLVVKPPSPFQFTSFFSCCSRTNRYYDVDLKYKTRILGSAAYGLAAVARGSAIISFEVTPKIWDFSASWLITEEANGCITPLAGKEPYPLTPGLDYAKLSYPLLAAASPELLIEGKTKIRKKPSV